MSVFPLVNKDGLPEKAQQVYRMLLDEGFTVVYDVSGSIGRRYARADEAGTLLGITVDYDTVEKDTVTLRDRNSWKQVSANLCELPELLQKFFRNKLDFEDLGKIIER